MFQELGYDLGNDGTPRSLGVASMGSGGGSNQASSKAVLAALRALQDKIRRLESERSQALDECAQLRHQMKNQEIEAEHAKQRDQLLSQKTQQEARNAYERLIHDKTDLEQRLSKLDERNKANQVTSEELQIKLRALEEEKQNSLFRVRDLETQQQQLETRIQQAEQKEKGTYTTKYPETKASPLLFFIVFTLAFALHHPHSVPLNKTLLTRWCGRQSATKTRLRCFANVLMACNPS